MIYKICKIYNIYCAKPRRAPQGLIGVQTREGVLCHVLEKSVCQHLPNKIFDGPVKRTTMTSSQSDVLVLYISRRHADIATTLLYFLKKTVKIKSTKVNYEVAL